MAIANCTAKAAMSPDSIILTFEWKGPIQKIDNNCSKVIQKIYLKHHEGFTTILTFFLSQQQWVLRANPVAPFYDSFIEGLRILPDQIQHLQIYAEVKENKGYFDQLCSKIEIKPSSQQISGKHCCLSFTSNQSLEIDAQIKVVN